MPFGINLQDSSSRPTSLQNFSNSLFGDPSHESNSGFFAGLPEFLKFAGTAGVINPVTRPSSFGSGGSNSMELPTLTPNTGVSNLPSIPKVGGIDIGAILASLGIGGKNGPSMPGAPASNNDYLKWLIPLLGGVTGALDNRAQKTTTAPTYDAKVSPLRDTSIDQYMKLLTSDPGLEGYQASQTSDINHQSDIQKRLAEETLASKGVFGPAVGTSLNNIDANRFAAITKLKQNIPMMANQLQRDNLSSVSNFLGQNKGSEVNTSGNMLGGAFGGTTELLAYLYGLGKI